MERRRCGRRRSAPRRRSGSPRCAGPSARAPPGDRPAPRDRRRCRVPTRRPATRRGAGPGRPSPSRRPGRPSARRWPRRPGRTGRRSRSASSKVVSRISTVGEGGQPRPRRRGQVRAGLEPDDPTAALGQREGRHAGARADLEHLGVRRRVGKGQEIVEEGLGIARSQLVVEVGDGVEAPGPFLHVDDRTGRGARRAVGCGGAFPGRHPRHRSLPRSHPRGLRHGRQRPVGAAPRTEAHRRPRGRRGGALRHRRGRARARDQVADRVRVQHRELEAADRRGPLPDGVQRADPASAGATR